MRGYSEYQIATGGNNRETKVTDSLDTFRNTSTSVDEMEWMFCTQSSSLTNHLGILCVGSKSIDSYICSSVR